MITGLTAFADLYYWIPKLIILLYGMADISILELAAALHNQKDPRSIRWSLLYPVNPAQSSPVSQRTYLELPSFDRS